MFYLRSHGGLDFRYFLAPEFGFFLRGEGDDEVPVFGYNFDWDSFGSRRAYKNILELEKKSNCLFENIDVSLLIACKFVNEIPEASV